MRRAWLWVALLAAGVAAAPAAEDAGRAAELLAEGNAAYERHDYAGAADAYQRVLDYGLRHELVYYNLGNARFKQGRLGEAILRYEQALRLDPGDREAADNLRYAEGLTLDRVEAPEPPILVAAGRWLLRLTTPAEDAGLLLAAAWLLAVAACLWIVAPRRLFAYLAGLFLALALLAGAALALKEGAAEGAAAAVVLAEKADVLSAPASDATSLFTVHEGLRVEVRGMREGWAQILLPNGLNGWVPASALGMV